MTELHEGELFVAPGKTPHVLQVVRCDYGLRLVELVRSGRPMTPEQVTDTYGWATPVWRYASLERTAGPAPEVPVQDVTEPPWRRLVDAMRHRRRAA